MLFRTAHSSAFTCAYERAGTRAVRKMMRRRAT
jgi:hypothetical protein